MSKDINMRRFFASWFKARRFLSDNECGYVQAALQDQGFRYDYGSGEVIQEEVGEATLDTDLINRLVDQFRHSGVLDWAKGTEKNYPDELGRLTSIYRRGVEDTLKEIQKKYGST